MFGMTLSKLLFTVFIVAVVWYGFKFYQRMQERQMASRDQVRVRRHEATRPQEKPTPSDVEDMVECAICHAFVSSRSTRACGRDGCPYPG